MTLALKPNMFLQVKTKPTPRGDEVFGTVLYRILEVGLPRPLPGATEKDGVKVQMLGGTGPSARAGLELVDYEERLQADMAKGLITIMPSAQAAGLAKRLKKVPDVQGPGKPTQDVAGKLETRHGGTGVVDLG